MAKASSLQLDGFESPSGIDAPLDSLEYITVDSYQWPKSGRSPRKRMPEEERKQRHREIQRESVARKRARVQSLQGKVRVFEKQLMLLQATREAGILTEEKHRWRAELELRQIFSVPYQETTDTSLDELYDPLIAEALAVLTQPIQLPNDRRLMNSLNAATPMAGPY